MNEIRTPKVTLVTWTQLPLESVYSVWESSKNEKPLMTPEEVRDKVPSAEVEDLFRRVIAQHIPIGEHIDFVFVLENISVSWREQAVRHRIGTKASPERLGIDMVAEIIPDLAESSWWSQSMRIQDMGRFADVGAYRVPETLLAHPDQSLRNTYHETMAQIQSAYNALVKAGIPMEDARELIPLGAQHRMSWRLNISSLQHIVGKRGCWILQLGIWGPVIEGMINELVKKVHPIFAELVTPPCLKGDTYTGCAFQEEVRRRYTGDDALPPCPLHFHHEVRNDLDDIGGIAKEPSGSPEVQAEYKVPRAAEMRDRAEHYRSFWGRDPYTGRRLRVLP